MMVAHCSIAQRFDVFFLQLVAVLILVHFFEKAYTILGEGKKRRVLVTLEGNNNTEPEEETN